MSKSTLSIAVPLPPGPKFPLVPVSPRTIEVPCRLPEAFTFKVITERFGLTSVTAWVGLSDGLNTAHVGEVEAHGDALDEGFVDADRETIGQVAEAILASIKTYFGMGPDVPPTTRGVLSAIALAYEAEVAAYDAAVKAHAALPRVLHSIALTGAHPSESGMSPSVWMLAKYVEHVVEQACKAQTERAEQVAKEAK